MANSKKFTHVNLRIEIFPEADHVMSEDINLGGLELGMFERVKNTAISN